MSPTTTFYPMKDLSTQFETIQHQGQRPTCVAFAVTACHEFKRTAITQEKLSEEFLYRCCKIRESNESPGTYVHIALDNLGTVGQSSEEIMPYQPYFVGSILSIPLLPHVYLDAKSRRIEQWKEESRNHKHLESLLDSNVPVIAVVEVQQSFFTASDTAGFIDVPATLEYVDNFHAIVIVGYGEDDEGNPYYLIRNSWGTDWGQKGYGYMSYAYFHRFATRAWSIC